jgi:hypothetical protein
MRDREGPLGKKAQFGFSLGFTNSFSLFLEEQRTFACVEIDGGSGYGSIADFFFCENVWISTYSGTRGLKNI